jgi:penicillin-insensitive murein DD-endopeptidase
MNSTCAGTFAAFLLLSAFAARAQQDAQPNTAPPSTPPAPATKAVVAPPAIPAKILFGKVATPAPLEARAIGYYSKGCLSGAQALPVDGPAWQAMRLSRNRNWGHPALLKMIERLALDARSLDGWPGLLVGDMSQPRGGPMITGHASHQIGLDADLWFTPMPDRRLTTKEREDLSATSMLAPGDLAVNPQVWTQSHVNVLRRAASYPEVERVLVHPAIKKALCEAIPQDQNRVWLSKVRPYWGHFYHFHVRIGCPAGMTGCQTQAPIPTDDGCGKELADWYVLLTAPPKPRDPSVPPEKPTPPMTLDQMPQECRVVLNAGQTAR